MQLEKAHSPCSCYYDIIIISAHHKHGNYTLTAEVRLGTRCVVDYADVGTQAGAFNRVYFASTKAAAYSKTVTARDKVQQDQIMTDLENDGTLNEH